MKTLKYGEYKIEDSQPDLMSKIKKADFCLYDGEGVTGEAYFFKIVRARRKIKSLKVIGCLTKLDESAYNEDTLEAAISQQREFCKQCTAYPMIFLRENILTSKLDDLRYKQKMPFVYKGCGARLFYGDDSSNMRFTYIDDMYDNEKTLTTLAFAAALELMTKSGEIDKTDYPKFLP